MQASTFMVDQDADELVRRLIAERISRRKIRLLPPNSVFRALRPMSPEAHCYIPETLPPAEVGGHRFVLPLSQWRKHDRSVVRWYTAMFAKEPLVQMAAQ